MRSLVAVAAVLGGLAGCADDPPAHTATSAAPSVSISDAGSPSETPSVAAATAPGASPTARYAAAAAYVAKQPGKLGIVVRDRVTGAVWRAGATTQATWTASTIKLAIAADLLERNAAGELTLTPGDRTNLAAALHVSDNDAATALWNKYDNAATLARFSTRYGMTGLSVVPGMTPFWRNLYCTAEDLQAVMSYVLDKLPAADRAYLVNALRGVAGLQHWGVWAAGAAQRPGNKDGWVQKPVDGTNVWMTHTVGFAGPDERYVVAIMFQQKPGGSLAIGAHTVSDLVATVFGAKTPAAITFPS